VGAFNWIQFEQVCPACECKRTIVAQTHVASSYDGKGEDRFHDATYRLGETMRWWESRHPQYRDWKTGNLKNLKDVAIREEYECCYANCAVCDVDLYAIIKFIDCMPKELLELGVEVDWPEPFFR